MLTVLSYYLNDDAILFKLLVTLNNLKKFYALVLVVIITIANQKFYDFSVVVSTEAPRNPCNPSPCGANAICKERNGAGSCACLPEYTGDPYTGCRPECVTNSDCDRSKACFNNKCKDPCPGACGLNAECRVINHSPSCYCLPGYSGNAMSNCFEQQPGK